MSTDTLKPFSPLARSLKINGIYEHYKGQRYKVLAIARHSETLEELAVYQALYGPEEVWVRPAMMFLEETLVNGSMQPRFKLVS